MNALLTSHTILITKYDVQVDVNFIEVLIFRVKIGPNIKIFKRLVRL